MKISISREMPVARTFARDAVKKTLLELQKENRPDGVSLGTGSAAGEKRDVRVEVPIDLETTAKLARWNEDFSVAVRAHASVGAFPTFAGSLAIRETAADCAQVTLSGEYHVPLGLLGAAIDAVALNGVARSSLERLLDRIVRGAMERIDHESTEAYIASRRGFV